MGAETGVREDLSGAVIASGPTTEEVEVRIAHSRFQTDFMRPSTRKSTTKSDRLLAEAFSKTLKS